MQTRTEHSLTIADVAHAAGVSLSAVRFYEAHGLVTAARTSGNQRRFTESAACRIRVARVAQRIGMTVREIADMIDDLSERPDCMDWAKIGRRLVAEAERRIGELTDVLDELQSDQKLCEL